MNNQNTSQIIKFFLGLLVISIIVFSFLIVWPSRLDKKVAAQSTIDGTPSFLPLVIKQPTPSLTPVPPMPQFVKNIPVPAAICPNEIGINENTGIAYMVNNYSHDVSLFLNDNYLSNIPTGGKWPSRVTIDPDSDRAFVANLHSIIGGPPTPLTAFQGTTITGLFDQYFEGHSPLYNPVNDYLYVADLDSDIRVFDAANTNLTFLRDIGFNDGIRGWITSITVDLDTGLVFAASWDYGKIYVINGTQLIHTMDTHTWGPKDLAIDSENHLLYVVGQEVKNRPDGYPDSNISVFSTQAPYQRLASFTTAQNSISVDYDPVGGFTYVVNPKDDTISVFSGLTYLGNHPVGDFPWHVKVHPKTGYAFVANRQSHTISVFKDNQPVVTIPSQGETPWNIGINTKNDFVYVVNRGDERDLYDCVSASVTILR
jgi:DNA-binding beta-propeller fold protein YncE